MSGLIVGLVWELPITKEFSSETKFVALAYADHAWQDGTHAYPSIDLVAKKTGYFERTVQRHVRICEKLGVLKLAGKGPHGTNSYSFPLEILPDGAIRLSVSLARGVSLTPLAKKGGVSPVTPESVTPESVTPEPKVVVNSLNDEEERKPSPNFTFSLELADLLTEAGIYRSKWLAIENRLQEGWTEADIRAVLAWMKGTRSDATRVASGFVVRIAEKTKAPRKWYPVQIPENELEEIDENEPETEPEQADQDPDADGAAVRKAWEWCVGQLKFEMPRGNFAKYVESIQEVNCIDGIVLVQAEDANARDWLESRMESTVRHLLSGMLSREVSVEFVLSEMEAV